MIDYFRAKRITVMGLGLLGRGVGDARFLAEQGAELIITDLKTAEELKPSLEALQDFSTIRYILGEHRLEDFQNRDLIIRAPDAPLDSPYLLEARKHGIPVIASTALFAKLTPAVIIGITGTRGKSTTTQLIYEILSNAFSRSSTRVFLGGNVRGVATLPFLSETKAGDWAVLELDSWQLQSFGDLGLSPHIAVFTTFYPDHQNYYRHDMDRYFEDKAHIFKYQKEGDVLILGRQVAPIIREKYPDFYERAVRTPEFPQGWEWMLPGTHNRDNAALAIEAARRCGVSDDVIRPVVASWRGVPGRLQKIREIQGISYYNDTTATTPDAVRAALEALGGARNVILIMGGSNKELEMSSLIAALPETCKAAVVLPGTGTDLIRADLERLNERRFPVFFARSMEEAVRSAHASAVPGDTVLLSPGFASFGLFKNEFDRGDQFTNVVNMLPG